MRSAPCLLILVWLTAWASPLLAGPEQTRFEDLIGRSRSAMLADPAQALGFARQAVAAAAPIVDARERQLAQTQGHWLEAEALNRTGDPDQAGRVAEDRKSVV